MGTSCDALNQTSRGHKLHDEIENSKAADSIPLDLKDSEMMSWLEKTIQKYENWKGRVFKEKDVKAAIKKRYGSKALREQWVAKLNLILDANEGIRDIIWDTALMEMIKVKDKSVFIELVPAVYTG